MYTPVQVKSYIESSYSIPVQEQRWAGWPPATSDSVRFCVILHYLTVSGVKGDMSCFRKIHPIFARWRHCHIKLRVVSKFKMSARHNFEPPGLTVIILLLNWSTTFLASVYVTDLALASLQNNLNITQI